jgi:hypothetical protein
MSTFLATAVALCFVWSLILFFAAVFVRERAQEDGFGWALGGALLFFVVFADRLPGQPMQLREVVAVLPGVTPGRELFVSSLVALIALLVVYAFRIAVFYQLVLRDRGATAGSDEDLANDVVAPPLSYFCFAICAVALLQPAYALGPLETALLCIALVVAYYGGVLPRLLHFFQDFWTELVVLTARARRAFERLVLEGVVLIAVGEDLRRGDKSSGFGDRARARLQKLKEEEKRAQTRRESLIAKAARGAKPGERTSR